MSQDAAVFTTDDSKTFMNDQMKNTMLPPNVSLQQLAKEELKEEIQEEIQKEIREKEGYKPGIKTLNNILLSESCIKPNRKSLKNEEYKID